MSRESERRKREATLRAVMARIEAAHPELLTHGLRPPTRPAGPASESPSPAPGRRLVATPKPAARDDEDGRDADPYAVARGIVLRQLTMAPRSRHQLREKLRERGCADEVAEAVLDRMSEVGLVDDEKYAEALVRSKQVTSGLAKRGLAHELRTKGVDREIADEVLAQVSSLDEEERARALVAARLPRLRGLQRDVAMRRLAGMLGRKGYPAGLSLRVIRKAIDLDPAFARD